MPRRKWPSFGVRFMGRPRTRRLSWRKQAWIKDEWHPHGGWSDVTPAPGRTYTRETWPPRGRGRGESLTSPRRISAKLRAVKVLQLRCAGLTFQQIGYKVGLSASGAYRAMQRTIDRIDWDRDEREKLRRTKRQ